MSFLVKENHDMGCQIHLNILQKTLFELKRALDPGLAVMVYTLMPCGPLSAVNSAVYV